MVCREALLTSFSVVSSGNFVPFFARGGRVEFPIGLSQIQHLLRLFSS